MIKYYEDIRDDEDTTRMFFDVTKHYKREELPQVPIERYNEVVDKLIAKGFKQGKQLVMNLAAIQTHYIVDKVVNKVIKLKSQNTTTPHKVFITAEEFHVLDGHHTMQAWQWYSPWTIVDVVHYEGSVKEALILLREVLNEINV